MRQTLLLLGVLGALAIGAYFALSPPEAEIVEEAPVMWRVERSAIIGFQITRRGQAAQVFTRQGDKWHVQPDGTPVPPGSAEGIALILTAPNARRKLPAGGDFGLNKPVLAVKVELVDSPAMIVTIGDPTPDGSGDYVQVGGEGAVFIVPDAWRRALVAFAQGTVR